MLTEKLSNGRITEQWCKCQSNVFTVDKLVWKILIPHLCVEVAFSLTALGIFNRSRPQRGIPSSSSAWCFGFCRELLSVTNHSLVTGCNIKLHHSNCRKEKGTQASLKYEKHGETLQNKVQNH